MVDLIRTKRDNGTLSREEIRFFIDGIVRKTIPDYQASALLMALFIQGMDRHETTALTVAMADSGARLDLSSLPGTTVDKHSTGGVADTTTLLLLPMLAACGASIVKMSGRGLGFTGGTLDKLESIPGFRIDLDMEEALAICKRTGAAILGQTADLCPADRILYALRDVTGTVESIPLIAASILSKKIASGADVIMLDVKCGTGAFMKNLPDALSLARTMVDIGRMAGKKTQALITSMDQPLGTHIGNALEVVEAIDVLKGKTKGDLLDVSLSLGAHMLVLAGLEDSMDSGRVRLQAGLDSGRALGKFKEILRAQGGNPAVCDDYGLLGRAGQTAGVYAGRGGYVTGMDTEGLGRLFVRLGGGRLTKEQSVDPTVGMVVPVRIGDEVHEGSLLATLHVRVDENCEKRVAELASCIHIGPDKPETTGCVLDIVT